MLWIILLLIFLILVYAPFRLFLHLVSNSQFHFHNRISSSEHQRIDLVVELIQLLHFQLFFLIQQVQNHHLLYLFQLVDFLLDLADYEASENEYIRNDFIILVELIVHFLVVILLIMIKLT